MKRYFNTKEKADKHLAYRKECAYTRIEKRGDKVLSDRSRVYKDAQDEKWKVRMTIWTDQMIKDIEKIQGFDFDAYNSALIAFSQDELKLKKEILKRLFILAHKTNEFEDNTIIKNL